MSRTKGATNRNKQFLMNRLRDMLGDDFEPVTQMAKNADFLQKLADNQAKDIDLHTVIEAPMATQAAKEANAEWDRVAKYTTPQLKSIEINLDANVTNHEGLPEVRERVDELLNGRADPSSEGDLSD